jgi:hypothetical protein
MASKAKVFIGGLPKMGTTNFTGLLLPKPVVKKTNIATAKGKQSNGSKKKQPQKKITRILI